MRTAPTKEVNGVYRCPGGRLAILKDIGHELCESDLLLLRYENLK